MYLSTQFPFLVFFIHLYRFIFLSSVLFFLPKRPLLVFFCLFFGNVDLLIMSDFSFCMSEKSLSLLLFKDFFFFCQMYYSRLTVFSFSSLEMLLHYFLAYIISNDTLLSQIAYLFFLTAFKNFSLSFVLSSSIIVCLDVIFFVLLLCGVC